MMVSFSSPPPSPLLAGSSPRSSPRQIHLRLPEVANLIVKLRRSSDKAHGKQQSIQSSSGEPKTHPSLSSERAILPRKVPLVEERRFLCRDGVDVKKLLRTMRASLLEEAQMLGANVLVDEEWTSFVHGPKRDGTYRVDIRYAASAARSDNIRDPQQPVALDKAPSAKGLMTVLE